MLITLLDLICEAQGHIRRGNNHAAAIVIINIVAVGAQSPRGLDILQRRYSL